MVFTEALRVCQLSYLQLTLLDLEPCSLLVSWFLVLLLKVMQIGSSVLDCEIYISENLHSPILNEVDVG